MKKTEAIKIFEDLKNEKHTVAEKCEAIIEVAQMPTHNSIKKASMVDAIRYLCEVLHSVLVGEAEEDVEEPHEA